MAFCFVSLRNNENKRFRRHVLQKMTGTINWKNSLNGQFKVVPLSFGQETSDKRFKNGANARENKRCERVLILEDLR